MKLQLPKLPRLLNQESSIDIKIAEALENDETIENVQFSKDLCRIQDLQRFEFRTSLFDRVNLNHVDLSNGYLLDLVFDNCDLSNIQFSQALLRRVHFKSCKLTGANFSEALLDQVTFENCQMDYSNFSNTKIKGFVAKQCLLSEASFNECDLKKAAFEHCNLTRCEFIQTSLKDQDLSTNNISGLMINLHHLRGAIVSEEQALQLSLLLGIKIKG